MATRASTQIVPHLWYVKEAKEAARFYVKIFPKSRIDRVWSLAGSGGSVECVEFRLFGQPFFAMTAGPRCGHRAERTRCSTRSTRGARRTDASR